MLRLCGQTLNRDTWVWWFSLLCVWLIWIPVENYTICLSYVHTRYFQIINNSGISNKSLCAGLNFVLNESIVLLCSTFSHFLFVCCLSCKLHFQSRRRICCSGSGLLWKTLLLWAVTVVSDFAEVRMSSPFPLHPLPKALSPVMFHDVASSIPVQRWKCFPH